MRHAQLEKAESLSCTRARRRRVVDIDSFNVLASEAASTTLRVGEDHPAQDDVRAGGGGGALELGHGGHHARNQTALAGGAPHSREGDVREQGGRVARGLFAREGTIYGG